MPAMFFASAFYHAMGQVPPRQRLRPARLERATVDHQRTTGDSRVLKQGVHGLITDYPGRALQLLGRPQFGALVQHRMRQLSKKPATMATPSPVWPGYKLPQLIHRSLHSCTG